jgi:hypothetical protein
MPSTKRLIAKFGHWLTLLGTVAFLGLYHLLVHLIPHLEEGAYKLSFADHILILFVGLLVSGAMHHQKASLEELVTEDLMPRIEALGRDIGIIKVRDSKDLSRYLVERFRTVKREIKIIDPCPARGGQWSSAYIEARDSLLTKGKHQERIVLINDRNDLKAVIALMDKHVTKPLLVKYFTGSDLKTLFSLLIIDDEQVHLGQGFLGDPGDGPTLDVELQSGEAAKAFTVYFNILWGQAHELKTLKEINKTEIAKIERELEDLDQPKLAVSTYVHQSYEKLLVLTQSSKRIEIISFPALALDSKERSKYFKTLRSSVISGAKHRRIIWNGDQVKFIQGWLTENGSELCNSEELEIRFWRREINEPLFYFDLLDRQTVLFAQNLLGDHFTQTRDPGFTEMIARYFDYVWELARKDVIKGLGKPPDFKLLEQLVAELKE